MVDASGECVLRWAEERTTTLDLLLSARDRISRSNAALSNECASGQAPFSWFMPHADAQKAAT
jgi:hypothetical protein